MRRSKTVHGDHGFSPNAWPTHEEYLEVFGDAIVATCRSVVLGTVSPRTLGDASREPNQIGDTGHVPHGRELRST